MSNSQALLLRLQLILAHTLTSMHPARRTCIIVNPTAMLHQLKSEPWITVAGMPRLMLPDFPPLQHAQVDST